jgi:hypothetical protein
LFEIGGAWKGGALVVTLTPEDLEFAAEVGRRRLQMNLDGGRGDSGLFRGFPGQPVEGQHILGTTCELAFSKALGVPWDGMLFEESLWQVWRSQGHDVGPFEIRGTTHPQGRLIVRDRDNDDSPFVLVRLADATCTVCGWLYGREAKHETYKKNPDVGARIGPAYFVQARHLRSTVSLLTTFRQVRQIHAR